jgi:preprotein translocase subunit SecG
MDIFLTVLHVLIAALLILAVLLQSGKGAGLASSLGGGLSSSSVLGGRTAATFLSKTTSILATAFLASCMLQSVIKIDRSDEPTTAMERLLEEGGLPLSSIPVPFSVAEETPVVPEEVDASGN